MTTVKALEVWTAQTICDVGIMLSVVSGLQHLGRPYFERILGRPPHPDWSPQSTTPRRV